ncbi:MAG: MoaD/ThiS family protein [Pseudomonadota bacterium]
MATVIYPTEFQRFNGGIETEEVAASNYRELVKVLGERYPDLAEPLANGATVAIDGEIIHSPFLESIGENSEVCFINLVVSG